MRIDDLEVFRVLAETLSYTNTANRLYLTQSSLTRTIQQMEEELGFQLFDRSRRSVSLTAAGESFYRESQAVLESYRACVEKARDAEHGASGVVRFGAHMYFTNGVVYDIIEGFQAEHADILLKISSNDTEHMIHALNEGEIDCAICTGRSSGRDVERIALKRYRDCAVLSPQHPLAEREELDFSDLKNERFMVISRKLAGRGYEQICDKAHTADFDPNIEEQADSVAHLLALVATGKYVTILSENYQAMSCNRLRFVPLTDDSTVELAFLWNRSNQNPCVRTLADYVRQNFKRRVGDTL